MLVVVTESQVLRSPRAFDKAWASPASMLILPDALADEFWIHARLALVPADLQTGHLLLWHRCPAGRCSLSIAPKAALQAQALLSAKAQSLEPVERVLVTLSLAEPYALVNQWIWAMMHQRIRAQVSLREGPGPLLRELESGPSTLLCLDKAQAERLVGGLKGRRYDAVTRICLVNTLQAEALVAKLGAIFPQALCFAGEGSAQTMSYHAMRGIAGPGPAWRGQGEHGALERVAFSSRQAAVAYIDDHALHRYGPSACIKPLEAA